MRQRHSAIAGGSPGSAACGSRPVRGVEKVKAVLLWHALAHNMARLWSLAPA